SRSEWDNNRSNLLNEKVILLRRKSSPPLVGTGVAHPARDQFSLVSGVGRKHACPPAGAVSAGIFAAIAARAGLAEKDFASLGRRICRLGWVRIVHGFLRQRWFTHRSSSHARTNLQRTRHPRLGNAFHRHCVF